MTDHWQHYPEDYILAAGDSSAQHQEWGYQEMDARGLQVKQATEAARLMLANDTNCLARCKPLADEHYTTPDLTWAEQGLVTEWRHGADPVGSDLHPLCLELAVQDALTGPKCVPESCGRTCKRVPVTRLCLRSAQGATRRLMADESAPAPDKHLLVDHTREP